MSRSAASTQLRRSAALNVSSKKTDGSGFSSPLFLLRRWPGELRAKMKALSVGFETLSGNPHGLDKASGIRKEDIFGNASSRVQLCYLNKLCGIIIRLMPGPHRLLQG